MAATTASADLQEWLLCRVGAQRCAVPLSCVAEIMRTLPIEPIAGAPRFVSGVCVIRGVPVPVVDVASLIDEPDQPHRRLVSIRVGERTVALAVDEVLGVEPIAIDVVEHLPPLLHDAALNAVRAIRVLDGELLLLLEASRLVSDAVFESLGSLGSASLGSAT